MKNLLALNVLALMILLLCNTPALALIQPDERLPDPAAEARAIMLGDMILCPVCDGQSINGSASAVAVAMRGSLREQIGAGRSDHDILAWFRQRYGESIISRPPLTFATLGLWLMPVLILTLGGVVILRTVRQAKK